MIDRLEDEKALAMAKCLEKNDELTDAQLEIVELKRDIDARPGIEKVDELLKRIARLEDDNAALLRKDAAQQKGLIAARDEIVELKRVVDNPQIDDETRQRLANLEQEKTDAMQKYHEKQEELSDARSEIAELTQKSQNSMTRDEIIEFVEKLSDLEDAEISEKQEELSDARSEIAELTQKSQNSMTRDEIIEFVEKLSDLEEEKDNFKRQCLEKDIDLAKLRDRIGQLEREVLSTKGRMEELVEAVSRSEEEKATEINALKEEVCAKESNWKAALTKTEKHYNDSLSRVIVEEDTLSKDATSLQEQAQLIPNLQRTIKDSNDNFARKEKDYDSKLATLRDQCNGMLDKLKNTQEMMSRLEQKVKELVLEAQRTTLEERIRSLEEENKTIPILGEQLTSIKDALTAQRVLLKERIRSLEEENKTIPILQEQLMSDNY
eukprot:CAMPEP_0172519466 /NCGR_PEP_ID=MMETSP1066-20121228/291428_1 /TAXON_ID=671091 /ORGANISM="Coscinodiscus wailesii, Strain CCMP2513" /LENGTH=436 /DNA_ID=CAMNT_0013302059 /DNA_START=586 /DNA_END=1897 /DNA_ORIENTATION=+